MLDPGAVIGGRYRLIRLLGQGGMGVVWHAKNEAIDRDVAVKLMLPELANDAGLLQRFFNEARICGSIRHPGIVDVLDLGRTDEGAPFIVMELLDGHPLDTFIQSSGRLPPATILQIVRDVANTVELAHQKGVIHRDLKPGNVFLQRLTSGATQVKVLDFGVSKITAPGSLSQTRTGSTLGSPAYMSPEQAGGRATVDVRTDVYAMGVILYEGLTGHVPFADAPTPNALLIDLVTRDVPPITDVLPGIAPSVAALVHGCLERDRERRFGSAKELAARIDAELRMQATRRDVMPPGGAWQPAAAAPVVGHAATQSAAATVGLPAAAAAMGPPQRSAQPSPPMHVAPEHTVAPLTRTGATPQASRATLIGSAIAAAVVVLAIAVVGGRAWLRRGHTSDVAPAVAETSAPPLPVATATAAPSAEPAASADSPPEGAPSATPEASASAQSSAGPSSRPRPSGKSPAKTPRKGKDNGAWGFDYSCRGRQAAPRQNRGRRALAKLALVAAIAAAGVAVSVPARAQGKSPPTATADAEEKARQAFGRGTEAATAGRWAEACPAFQEAHTLFPTNGTALRLADCYEKTNRPNDAYDLYAYILANAASEKHGERIEIAKQRMAEIEKQRAAQAKPSEAAPAPTTPAAPVAPPPEKVPNRLPAYVAFGVGGAGVVVGAIFGALALSQASSVKDACPDAACATPDLLAAQQEERDGALTKGWVANVGFGVGVVGVAVGVVLLVTGTPTKAPVTGAGDCLVLRF